MSSWPNGTVHVTAVERCKVNLAHDLYFSRLDLMKVMCFFSSGLPKVLTFNFEKISNCISIKTIITQYYYHNIALSISFFLFTVSQAQCYQAMDRSSEILFHYCNLFNTSHVHKLKVEDKKEQRKNSYSFQMPQDWVA